MTMTFEQIHARIAADAERLVRDGARIVRAPRLTPDLLARLARREILAVHVPGYFSAQSAARAAKRLSPPNPKAWVVQKGDVRYATDALLAGDVPRQFTARSAAWRAAYYRKAAWSRQRLRDAFAPTACPIDVLRLELDEMWPAGARVPRDAEGMRASGLVRTMRPDGLLAGIAGERGTIHADQLFDPANPVRLSANLYLAVPPNGGELAMWDVALNAANAENTAYRFAGTHAFADGAQEILHDVYPRPRRVKPAPGDLVLLDTARPHAIAGFRKGQRMSIQAWVVAIGRSEPLDVYS